MNRTSCSRAALILGGALLLHPSPAHWLVRAAEPYLRYRDLSLGYTGPDEARTNLAEIRIAWFGPSDPLDRTAGGMWWAASRAVREANEAGGYRESAAGEGRPFRLIPSWSTNVWGAGVAQLARLVYEAEPVALVGSIDSATTHLAEQVVAKANLPLVSPVTTDQSITLAGVSWMFACAPSDPVIARVLVQHLVTGLSSNRDKVVVVNTTDHESRMQAREVLKALNLHQLTPQFRFEVPPGTRAITAQLRALAPFRPATVLVVASAEDSARLVRAIREGSAHSADAFRTVADRTSTHREDDQAAARPLILGTHHMACARFRDLVGAAGEGVQFPLLFPPGTGDGELRRFAADFEAELGHSADFTATLTYDATRLLIECIRQAGPNRLRIRDALSRTAAWPGLSGPIQFDGTGQNRRTDVGMGTIQKGTIVPVHRAGP